MAEFDSEQEFVQTSGDSLEDEGWEEMDYLISKMRSSGLSLADRLNISASVISNPNLRTNVPLLLASYLFLSLSKPGERTEKEFASEWNEDVALDNLKGAFENVKSRRRSMAHGLFQKALFESATFEKSPAMTISEMIQKNWESRQQTAPASGIAEEDRALHEMLLAKGRELNVAEALKEDFLTEEDLAEQHAEYLGNLDEVV